MKIVAIIAEFNPFHNGHKYIVDKAKELTNADVAICIVSGNYTQAGNIAIKDKFERANIVIKNGVDVVIELPTIYATSSSEFFAFGAVNILNSLNCVDYLCFGSETGDIEILKSISKKLLDNNEAIWDEITKNLRLGISFAEAREKSIGKFLTSDEVAISKSSNNILAIEYIKSLIKLNSNIVPIAIKREESSKIVSATKIRELLKSSSNVSEYLPNYTLDNSLLFNDSLFQLIKYKIVTASKEYLSTINEINEGLENKLYSELNNSKTYDEFVLNVKSKRYQLSKIKRIMLNILLDITKEKFMMLNNDKNIYIHIIAINPNIKSSILSYFNKKSKAIILTSINDDLLKKLDSPIKESILLDIKAANIYSTLLNDKINKDYTNKL